MFNVLFDNLNESISSITSFVIPFMVYLYLARFCLKNTDRAGSIVGLDELDESSEIIMVQDAQIIAFSVIGLILVVLAIPKLIGFGTHSLYYSYLEQNRPELTDRMVMVGSADMLGLIIKLPIQILMGLYLFFRPRRVVDLWQRSQEKQKFLSEDV